MASGLDSQICDDVAHDRQIDKRALEGATIRGVVDRLAHRLTHETGGADREVQPCVVGHLDDGADPTALLATNVSGSTITGGATTRRSIP
jgi:hypothetical protein